MPLPHDPRDQAMGFPPLQWEEDDIPTRPMPLHELPTQARVDHEMAVIEQHHMRIALVIKKFWGHRDCIEYMQTLLLKGGDGDEKKRVGFKAEVSAALINLIALHRIDP